MARRSNSLGRNIDIFLSKTTLQADRQKNAQAQNQADIVSEISIESIQPGKYQPRRAMDPDALQELADSIVSQGIIQPILLRPIGDADYEIIAGERRWRAAQLAGLKVVPAIIRDIPDEATLAVALIENLQREDLNPLEEAHALQRLIDEFELTHQALAQTVGKSRVSVSNLLRLLKLNGEVKVLLERGDIDVGHAKVLLTLDDAQQLSVAREVVAKGLTVRDLEKLIYKLQQQSDHSKSLPEVSSEIASQTRDITNSLGISLQVKPNHKGGGKLVIPYQDEQKLAYVLDCLRK